MKAAETASGEPRKINRVVAYVRVSTDEQAELGVGLEAQSEACKTHCDRAKLELVGLYRDEGISGGAPLDKRPGLAEALGSLGPGDVFLVARRDRLGRDPMLVAMIETIVRGKKARIVSAAGEGTDDDSPTSILLRRMIDAIAEFERLKIKANTVSGLAILRRDGRVSGTVPYGFEAVDDGHYSKKSTKAKEYRPSKLVESGAERNMIKRVNQLADLKVSLRKIAKALDVEGFKTKGGKPWNHNTVRKILARSGPKGVA